MARVVVIFAILLLITGAMFWLARHPSGVSQTVSTDAVVTTVPVAATEKSDAGATPVGTATHPDIPEKPQEGVPTGGDALPPAETSVPAMTLPTTGDAANVLQQTTTTRAAQTGLVVENVHAGNNDTIALTGRADAGATVKVSVNGKTAGQVTVKTDGSWSLSVEKGKGATEPKIALELVGADGKLLDKTDFVFKTVSAGLPVTPQDQALIGAHTVVPKHVTAKPKGSAHSFRVRRGESLWRIARRKLGAGHNWRELYEANKDAIGGNPDYVRAGTRLVIPG